MRRTIFMLVSVLALSACAGGGDPGGGGMPAPTPKSVTTRFDAAQDGAHVTVKVGEPFAVELVGVPTAGYVWAPETVPEFLILEDTLGGPTSKAQLQPGFAGGSHWEVHIFKATWAGEGALVLAQKRAWEDTEPPAATFTLHVTAVAP